MWTARLWLAYSNLWCGLSLVVCGVSACDSAADQGLQRAVGGSSSDPAASGGSGTGGSTAAPPVLPPLHVEGPLLKDPTGKTIVLRGVSLIDIGQLYSNGGKNISGITKRIDKVLASGLKPHVIRLPIYPRTVANGDYPAYSPVPYPLGADPGKTQANLTQDDYFNKILKPAVDYVSQLGMYAIVDYHQIDDTDDAVTHRTSAADATAFWQYMADKFKDYPNVIYEAFNEPVDMSSNWPALKQRVQTWVDTIRAAAPDNIIIIPSRYWCQCPGDAATSPPTGSNFMYTAHVYPGNWGPSFQKQINTATAIAPVFFSEWGYATKGGDTNLVADTPTWGADFRTFVDANSSGSWTAWVTDSSWQPAMFSNSTTNKLTEFGTLASTWLSDKYTSDWVE